MSVLSLREQGFICQITAVFSGVYQYPPVAIVEWRTIRDDFLVFRLWSPAYFLFGHYNAGTWAGNWPVHWLPPWIWAICGQRSSARSWPYTGRRDARHLDLPTTTGAPLQRHNARRLYPCWQIPVIAGGSCTWSVIAQNPTA
jgi:hypothetical protein